MKRLVILSAFLSPLRSGAEACAEEIALRLADHYEVTIVTARMRRDLPKYDRLQGRVPVIRVGFGFSFDKWLYPFLAPFAARKLKPDILHAVLETFAGLALHASRMIVPCAKHVLTLQTTNRTFLRKYILRTPHAVTAISDVLAKQAKKLGRRDVVVIPNGIDLAAIRGACSGHSKVPGRILFVGRLESMKGVDTLLRAFAALPSILRSDASLHIVGDGSQRAALQALTRELGIDTRVAFRGYLPPPVVYVEFAEAEIFCGLSTSEALGNVFLEAQTAGCAVIGTNVGGIPEIVHENETGLLIPPNDPKAATGALQKLLADGALRARLAAAAQFHAEEFEWDAIAERYEEVYSEL